MKQIVFAFLITAILGVGGVALTFAIRSPDAAPKLFTSQELAGQEAAYRGQVVAEANALIEKDGLGEALPAAVKDNLNRLSRIMPKEQNNRLVDSTVRLVRGADAPQAQKSLNTLASFVENRLTVRWEPNPEAVKQGHFIYNVSCQTCHGRNGDGSPITPEGLAVTPRDFTGQSHSAQRVVFKFNTSDRPDMLALDEDLKTTITEGLPGTPMPGFAILSPEEINALLDYIKTFGYASWKFNQPTRSAIEVPPPPQDLGSSKRIDDGRGLFKSRGCAGCHGDIEQGGKPPVELPTQWLDGEGKPILVWPRNFAVDPLKRPRLQDIFKTIRLGIKGTPMPANLLNDEETWNLIAYVLHLKQLGSEGKVLPK